MTNSPLFNKEITMFFTFLKKDQIEKTIKIEVHHELYKAIKELSEDTRLNTVYLSGRDIYYSADTIKGVISNEVSAIIDDKVNEIAKRVNDDLNRESLIDSIIERINKKQLNSK